MADRTTTNGRRPYRDRVERVKKEDRAQYNAGAKAELDARAKFIAAAELASAHHPQIPQQVFRDIIAAYDAEGEAFHEKELEARKKAMAEGNKGYYNAGMMDARKDLLANVRKRIEHHPDGVTAMQAISTEKQPESIFTPLVRLFYNSDKGGLQAGGLGGAAILGGAAYYLTKSAGTSSWLTIGGTVLATALGAYIGNKVVPSSPSITLPDFKTPAPVFARTRTPEIKPAGPDLTTKLDAIPGLKDTNPDIKPAKLTDDFATVLPNKQPPSTGVPTPGKA